MRPSSFTHRPSLLGWLVSISWLLLWPALLWSQPTNPDMPTYRRGGFSSINAMGVTLFKAVKPQYRDQLHFRPASLETDVSPYIRLEEYKDADLPRPMRLVFVSVGFIDLVNNLAHAKAADKAERGFFDRYVQVLAKESGEMQLPQIPRITDPKFWTDAMMNEQESNFSQMVGMIMAIHLSHHYLGHYQKYAEQLTDVQSKPVSINQFLTEAEWQAAVKAGTVNSLNAGYGIEGVTALFDALDRMQIRPPWAVHFLPPFVKVGKLKKYQKLLEDSFFANKEL